MYNNEVNKERKKHEFGFTKYISNRFKKWTGVYDKEITESLSNISGDTYYEMRRLISILLTEVEKKIESGEYKGFLDQKELTKEQKKDIKNVNEDLKSALRVAVENTWRSICNKQKIGIDKLGIAIKPYLNPDIKDYDQNSDI